MEYRVLGSLQVYDGGAEVQLGGRRQRTLLAVLLLNANTVVPSDRLIDEVWAGTPPETAAAALQNYVAQLRRLLEPDRKAGSPHRILVTQPPGYVLHVERDELDLERFERLAAEGRDALAAGRPARAASLLREALALWRGQLLADLADELFAHAEIARLEDRRLAALEERIDADLALGRHAGLVGELEALVAEQPLRERLRGQLMVALYRSGRQAEALEAYRAARRTLVDELGLEPSRALQELERAILNQDPALAPAPPASETTNLPAPPNPLIGRRCEREELVALLGRPDVRLVTITGAGGSGKTRLALEVGRDLVAAFADGSFFVPLSPIEDSALVLPTIARALDVGESSQPMRDRLAEELRERHLLLLLDNFEHVPTAAADIADLLTVAPRLKILATSRTRLRLLGEHEYVLPPLAVPDLERLPARDELERHESVALFLERARALRAGFAETDAALRAVAEICVRVDGLPLAVELAAARTKLLPPEAMLSRMDSRLELLTGGARDLPARQQTLRSTLDWSYRLLGESEQGLLAQLAVFAGGFTLDAADAVCGGDASLEELQTLVDASLVILHGESGGNPRLGMLSTIREYALERLEADGGSATARRRHAAFFLDLAERAGRSLRGPEQTTWLARLEADRNNLRAALSWSLEHSDRELLPRLALATWEFWWRHGYLREGRRWLEEARQRTEGERSVSRVTVLRFAAEGAWRQGDYGPARALAEESVALSREVADPSALARSLNTLGLVLLANEDAVGARAAYEESLLHFRELEQDLGIAAALSNLADLALHEQDYPRARELCEESLRVSERVGDVDHLAACSFNLALAEIGEGRHEEAEPLLRKSLSLWRETDTRDGIASCLDGLAAVLVARGHAERAARLLGAAETLREEISAAMQPADGDMQARAAAGARAKLDASRFAAAWEEGRKLTLEQAFDEALLEDAKRVGPAFVTP